MPYGFVTVFGGTGFLGRCIVEHLHRAGARVRVAVRYTTEGAPRGGDIEVVYADVRDGAAVGPRPSGTPMPSSMPLASTFHRAKLPFQAVHVDGAKVARAAREAGIGCLVHISGIGADVDSGSPGVDAAEAVVNEIVRLVYICLPSTIGFQSGKLKSSLSSCRTRPHMMTRNTVVV
jgi:nucleoside-diphosphate-sugar epimerase